MPARFTIIRRETSLNPSVRDIGRRNGIHMRWRYTRYMRNGVPEIVHPKSRLRRKVPVIGGI